MGEVPQRARWGGEGCSSTHTLSVSFADRSTRKGRNAPRGEPSIVCKHETGFPYLKKRPTGESASFLFGPVPGDKLGRFSKY